MKNLRRHFATIGALCGVLAVAASVFVARSRLSPRGPGRAYEVRYVWDNAVKSLKVINRQTGAEEIDRGWRNLASDEANRYLPGLVAFAGFRRAEGRFYLSFLGNSPPYLPRIADSTDDPDLIKDPDITPLMSALAGGEVVEARRLIAAGVNVKACDQRGGTALMRAAALGDATIVEALLAAGAEVNARNRDGETALFGAAFLNHVAAAQMLVKHGADVNANSHIQITPLMEAASHSPNVADLLIRSGANLNARDVCGGTALMTAARGGSVEIVRKLIKAGANVNAKDNVGQTALACAIASGHTEVADLLKSGGTHP